MPRPPTDIDPPPDYRHAGYANVSNGDGKYVKNWLLALLSAMLLMVGGGVVTAVVGLEARMTRIETLLEDIKSCLQAGRVRGVP